MNLNKLEINRALHIRKHPFNKLEKVVTKGVEAPLGVMVVKRSAIS